MAEVVFEKLSEHQRYWLTYMKVYGPVGVSSGMRLNIEKALINRGLAKSQRIGDWPYCVLTELGERITPDPTDEWIRSEMLERTYQRNDASIEIAGAKHRFEEAKRKLHILESLGRQ